MFSRYVDCECCLNNIDKNLSVKCNGTNRHRFCFNCVKAHVDGLLRARNIDISCISTDGCNGHLKEQDFPKFMDKQSLDYFYKIQQQIHIRSAFGDDLVACPFCSIESVQDERENLDILICTNKECGKTSCFKCKKEFHWPDPCNTGDNQRLKREETDTYKIIKACPGCNIDIFRTDGCSHMHCTECGTDFCYVCGEDITNKIWTHECPVHDTMGSERVQVYNNTRPAQRQYIPRNARYETDNRDYDIPRDRNYRARDEYQIAADQANIAYRHIAESRRLREQMYQMEGEIRDRREALERQEYTRRPEPRRNSARQRVIYNDDNPWYGFRYIN